MKLHRLLPLLCIVSFAATALRADQIVAGPRGGRLLDSAPHKAEFFVTPERKVEVTFYDAALKPVAPGARVVTLVAETPGGRVPVVLTRNTNHFASAAALPAGDPYRVVLQVRASADAKPQNFRVDLNLAQCAECNHKEYACTCAGH